MTIAFDANLGATDGGNVASVTLTTTGAAAANARVVVFVSYFQNSGATITGITVAGTACAQDKKVANGSDFFEIWSCNRSATTPTSSSIVVTFSNSTGGAELVGAVSFTGILSTGAVVTASSATGTGASWSSGSATNTGQADAVYVGGAGNEDATNPTTSTASGGSTEIHDRYRSADQQGIATGYKIVSVVASDSVTGTFSNSASTANTGALVIYADAGSGAAAAAASPLTFNAIPFMGGVL